MTTEPERLLTSEALTVLNCLMTPIFVFCFQTGSICWSNQAAKSVLGQSEGMAPAGEEPSACLLSDRERLISLRTALASGEARVETCTMSADPAALPVLCRFRSISIDGHDDCMLAEIIGERAKALPDSDARALEALRRTPLMITLFSESGTALMRNPASERCFSSFDAPSPTAQQHVVNGFVAMFRQPSEGEALFARARTGGRADATATMAIEGNPVHHIQVTDVRDPATGNTIYLVAQQDVTAIVKARHRLVDSDDALDQVLDTKFGPGLVLSLKDGKPIHANFAAKRLLQLEGGLAETASVFFREGDFLRFSHDVAKQTFASGHFRLVRSNRTPLWALVLGTRVQYRGIDAIAVSASDIDDLYREIGGLEQTINLLRDANARQRHLLALVSHEFHTPLAVIDSAAQRIENGIGSRLEDQLRAGAARIRATVTRLRGLVDMTVANVTQDEALAELVDIEALIRSVATSLGEVYPDAIVEISIRDIPQLKMKKVLLETVVYNLLFNAIKFSDGPAHVVISGASGPGGYALTFRDYGIGIPYEDRETVFDQFVRSRNAQSRPGTGLGLALVRQAIEAHGGMVRVADQQGPGTVIAIHLPASLAARAVPFPDLAEGVALAG